MANDYEYERGRYGRGNYARSEYDRNNREYSGSGERPWRGESGSDHEPFRGDRGRNTQAPYGGSDYGRYEYGPRNEEPSYRYGGRGEESGYRGRYDRGDDRGFFERAGDEVRSWFGDEEAQRRRETDEQRSGQYAGRGPKGYRRSDERIREDVNDRLTEDPYLDATNIEVSVSEGYVTLSGMVESRDDKRRAESLTESVAGVSDVSNQLRVNRTGQTSLPSITTESQGALRNRSART